MSYGFYVLAQPHQNWFVERDIMNVFVLDHDPVFAARALCDRHVVKMCLEYGQVLAGACRLLGRPDGPIKPTHLHHPVVVWTAASEANQWWVYRAWVACLFEYSFRYGREHAWDLYSDGLYGYHPSRQGPEPVSFCQCLPDDLKGSDPIEAYRSYYLRDKAYFAKWAKGRPAPDWWSKPSGGFDK